MSLTSCWCSGGETEYILKFRVWLLRSVWLPVTELDFFCILNFFRIEDMFTHCITSSATRRLYSLTHDHKQIPSGVSQPLRYRSMKNVWICTLVRTFLVITKVNQTYTCKQKIFPQKCRKSTNFFFLSFTKFLLHVEKSVAFPILAVKVFFKTFVGSLPFLSC